MNAAQSVASPSKAQRIVGRTLTTLAVAFLTFDTVIKLLVIGPVVDSMQRLQIPIELARGIGVLELVCLGICLVPRTALLGAILMTGFLGGATLTHLRIGDPWLTHTFFPAYVGLLLWGGLLLRDPRVRGVVPFLD